MEKRNRGEEKKKREEGKANYDLAPFQPGSAGSEKGTRGRRKKNKAGKRRGRKTAPASLLLPSPVFRPVENIQKKEGGPVEKKKEEKKGK